MDLFCFIEELLENEDERDNTFETHLNHNWYGGCNLPDKLNDKGTIMRAFTYKAINEYKLSREEKSFHQKKKKKCTKGGGAGGGGISDGSIFH